MKFWTVQRKEIINIVNEKGIYQPDFSKSDYLQVIPDLKHLYYMVLEAFNEVNNTNFPGLIFSFLKSDKESIYQIEDFNEFYAFIQNRKAAIYSMWNELKKKDAMILELEYETDFNPIYVDINDFQFLMPQITLLPPYTEQDIERICGEICNGEITRSIFPSYVIQAHLPNIKSENIVNTYPMFDFEDN